MKPRFFEAAKQAAQLKKLKSKAVRRFQESIIIKTLLLGLKDR